MSNTKMKWEANPQGVRKIVMELVSELDPSLLSSPAVEKCIHDITSYANEVANKARIQEGEFFTNYLKALKFVVDKDRVIDKWLNDWEKRSGTSETLSE